ncbi:hypothetical protein E1B28_002263 [Marasmius oreades]|uniref:Uncharacterized protein n=1 Tax=Marasmius oreades TaxID=181124 RepID=A0A9P7UNS5_9AGAR|nr:uncharacterized protein E1B28_002263 [Marasmius oreades]KAG7086299.1 hypothetical protein E1B28_002263 [Marasmius oreades]
MSIRSPSLSSFNTPQSVHRNLIFLDVISTMADDIIVTSPHPRPVDDPMDTSPDPNAAGSQVEKRRCEDEPSITQPTKVTKSDHRSFEVDYHRYKVDQLQNQLKKRDDTIVQLRNQLNKRDDRIAHKTQGLVHNGGIMRRLRHDLGITTIQLSNAMEIIEHMKNENTHSQDAGLRLNVKLALEQHQLSEEVKTLNEALERKTAMLEERTKELEQKKKLLGERRPSHLESGDWNGMTKAQATKATELTQKMIDLTEQRDDIVNEVEEISKGWNELLTEKKEEALNMKIHNTASIAALKVAHKMESSSLADTIQMWKKKTAEMERLHEKEKQDGFQALKEVECRNCSALQGQSATEVLAALKAERDLNTKLKADAEVNLLTTSTPTSTEELTPFQVELRNKVSERTKELEEKNMKLVADLQKATENAETQNVELDSLKNEMSQLDRERKDRSTEITNLSEQLEASALKKIPCGNCSELRGQSAVEVLAALKAERDLNTKLKADTEVNLLTTSTPTSTEELTPFQVELRNKVSERTKELEEKTTKLEADIRKAKENAQIRDKTSQAELGSLEQEKSRLQEKDLERSKEINALKDQLQTPTNDHSLCEQRYKELDNDYMSAKDKYIKEKVSHLATQRQYSDVKRNLDDLAVDKARLGRQMEQLKRDSDGSQRTDQDMNNLADELADIKVELKEAHQTIQRLKGKEAAPPPIDSSEEISRLRRELEEANQKLNAIPPTNDTVWQALRRGKRIAKLGRQTVIDEVRAAEKARPTYQLLGPVAATTPDDSGNAGDDELEDNDPSLNEGDESDESKVYCKYAQMHPQDHSGDTENQHKNEMNSLCRQVILECLNGDRAMDLFLGDPVSHERLELFKRDPAKYGPKVHKTWLDKNGYTDTAQLRASAWNENLKYKLKVLLEHIVANCPDKARFGPSPLIYWGDMLQDRFTALYSDVVRALPRSKAEANNQELVKSRLYEDNIKRNVRNGRVGFRRAKFDARMKISNDMIAISDGREDQKAVEFWKYVSDVTEVLGMDGMSDEEKDVEEVMGTMSGVTSQNDIVKVLKLPWRHSLINALYKSMDEIKKYEELVVRSTGSMRRTCVDQISTRRTPIKLPLSVFADGFLVNMRDYERDKLKLSGHFVVRDFRYEAPKDSSA